MRKRGFIMLSGQKIFSEDSYTNFEWRLETALLEFLRDKEKLKFRGIISLIEDGANPNTHITNTKSPYYGQTALNILLDQEDCSIADALKLIYLAGANRNAQNKLGRTLLHIAALKHQSYILKLLELGMDPNIQDNNGQTALSILLDQDYVSMDSIDNTITLIEKMKANLNTQNKLGRTLLHIAALKHQSYILKLLELGMDPNIQDNN